MVEGMYLVGKILNLIAVLSIAVLPIVVLYDSWHRFRRIGWEWAVMIFLLMSSFEVLVLDIVVPNYWSADTEFKQALNIIIANGGLIGFAFMIFEIYKQFEPPSSETNSKWKVFRSIGAGLSLYFIISSYSPIVLSSSLRIPIVLVSILFFILGQSRIFLDYKKQGAT